MEIYKHQWSHIGEKESNFEGVKELRECDQKEKEIKKIPKLLDEDNGNEGEDGVLLIANNINGG